MKGSHPCTRNEWIEWTGTQEMYLGFAARDIRRAAAAANLLIGATALALMRSSHGAFSSLSAFVLAMLVAASFATAIYTRMKLRDAAMQTAGFSFALRTAPQGDARAPGDLITVEMSNAALPHNRALGEVVSAAGTDGSARILLGSIECPAGRVVHFHRYHDGLPPTVSRSSM